jgi:hypothetical protein
MGVLVPRAHDETSTALTRATRASIMPSPETELSMDDRIKAVLANLATLAGAQQLAIEELTKPTNDPRLTAQWDDARTLLANVRVLLATPVT